MPAEAEKYVHRPLVLIPTATGFAVFRGARRDKLGHVTRNNLVEFLSRHAWEERKEHQFLRDREARERQPDFGTLDLDIDLGL